MIDTLAILFCFFMIVISCSETSKHDLSGVLWEYNRHHSQWEPVVDPERYKQHPNMMRIHQDFSTSAVDSSTDHHMSQDVVVPSQVPCRHLWPYHDSHGRRTNRPCRSYVLSVLWSKSIFCISAEGDVFERFWNDQKWVYVNHQTKVMSAIAVTAYSGRLYAVNADGSMFERRRVGQELKWIDASPPEPHKLIGPANADPDGLLWFVSSTGDLLECKRKPSRPKVCQSWVEHQRPQGTCLAAIADSSSFKTKQIFSVTTSGDVFEYSSVSHEWKDYGRPEWASIAPTQGVPIEHNGKRSLFLLSEWGELVELHYTEADQRWEWINHEKPGDVQITGPPGGLINKRSIFMVASDGAVYERYWDDKSWVWISHGTPSGVRAVPARPVALDNRHIFFLREDSLLAERFWNGEAWVWSIHQVPSQVGGSPDVKYCSSERGVQDSCVAMSYRGV